ncbi:MAG: diaminopropionate ammonia-lyase [Pseudomonadota bacterium]
MRVELNPFLDPSFPYSELNPIPVDLKRAAVARDDLTGWRIAPPTPLLRLPRLAARLGLGNVYMKDEGLRKPLKSFKSLGGAYALGEALRDRIEDKTGERPDYPSLFERRFADADFCAVAATDGNHGRSLAWGAQKFGVGCRIYIPNGVSEPRIDAIAQFGAEIIRVDGTYDATFAKARSDALANDWALIQDISTEDYTQCHQRIMEGYTIMGREMIEQLDGQHVSHAFLQVGCGGMAAAVMAAFIEEWGVNAPKFVLMEAETTASTLESFVKAEPVTVGGSQKTIMIGIAVGETSYLPWVLFKKYAHSGITVADQYAEEAMRYAASGESGDPVFVSGETGACGIAALMELEKSPGLRRKLDLDAESSVLLINTEGDTDPESYKRIVRQ